MFMWGELLMLFQFFPALQWSETLHSTISHFNFLYVRDLSVSVLSCEWFSSSARILLAASKLKFQFYAMCEGHAPSTFLLRLLRPDTCDRIPLHCLKTSNTKPLKWVGDCVSEQFRERTCFCGHSSWHPTSPKPYFGVAVECVRFELGTLQHYKIGS